MKTFEYKGLRISISDKLHGRKFSKDNVRHAKSFIDKNRDWSLVDLGYHMFNDITVKVEKI